jgi:hypothetical protein
VARLPRNFATLAAIRRASSPVESVKFTWQSPADKRTVSRRGTGDVMSKFERLLVAGSTELPDCRCTAEMNLVAIVPVLGGDTEIRIFRCPDCNHELRLTAWQDDAA